MLIPNDDYNHYIVDIRLGIFYVFHLSTLSNPKAQKETAIQMKETDKKIEETAETLKSVGIQLGNIGKNQGDVAEEFFVNSLSSTLKVADIQYDELYKNMYKKTKKIEGEFDIVLINGKDVAIIETKYKAHPSDLKELINEKHTVSFICIAVSF
jgi:hypothetical protein